MTTDSVREQVLQSIFLDNRKSMAPKKHTKSLPASPARGTGKQPAPPPHGAGHGKSPVGPGHADATGRVADSQTESRTMDPGSAGEASQPAPAAAGATKKHQPRLDAFFKNKEATDAPSPSTADGVDLIVTATADEHPAAPSLKAARGETIANDDDSPAEHNVLKTPTDDISADTRRESSEARREERRKHRQKSHTPPPRPRAKPAASQRLGDFNPFRALDTHPPSLASAGGEAQARAADTPTPAQAQRPPTLDETAPTPTPFLYHDSAAPVDYSERSRPAATPAAGETAHSLPGAAAPAASGSANAEATRVYWPPAQHSSSDPNEPTVLWNAAQRDQWVDATLDLPRFPLQHQPVRRIEQDIGGVPFFSSSHGEIHLVQASAAYLTHLQKIAYQHALVAFNIAAVCIEADTGESWIFHANNAHGCPSSFLGLCSMARQTPAAILRHLNTPGGPCMSVPVPIPPFSAQANMCAYVSALNAIAPALVHLWTEKRDLIPSVAAASLIADPTLRNAALREAHVANRLFHLVVCGGSLRAAVLHQLMECMDITPTLSIVPEAMCQIVLALPQRMRDLFTTTRTTAAFCASCGEAQATRHISQPVFLVMHARVDGGTVRAPQWRPWKELSPLAREHIPDAEPPPACKCGGKTTWATKLDLAEVVLAVPTIPEDDRPKGHYVQIGFDNLPPKIALLDSTYMPTGAVGIDVRSSHAIAYRPVTEENDLGTMRWEDVDWEACPNGSTRRKAPTTYVRAGNELRAKGLPRLPVQTFDVVVLVRIKRLDKQGVKQEICEPQHGQLQAWQHNNDTSRYKFVKVGTAPSARQTLPPGATRVVAWNARGFNQDRAVELVTMLRNETAMCGVVSEPYADSPTANAFLNSQGFDLHKSDFSRDGRGNRRGGVALVLSRALHARPRPPPEPPPNFPQRPAGLFAMLASWTSPGGETINLIGIYWTPEKQDDPMDAADGTAYLDWLVNATHSQDDITVIAGDFNARHPSWDPRFAAEPGRSMARGNRLARTAAQAQWRLQQQFATSHGPTSDGEAAVDLFFVTGPANHVTTADRATGSDHSVVFCTLLPISSTGLDPPPTTPIRRRLLHRWGLADWQSFHDSVELKLRRPSRDHASPGVRFCRVATVIRDELRRHVPRTLIRANSYRPFTSGALENARRELADAISKGVDISAARERLDGALKQLIRSRLGATLDPTGGWKAWKRLQPAAAPPLPLSEGLEDPVSHTDPAARRAIRNFFASLSASKCSTAEEDIFSFPAGIDIKKELASAPPVTIEDVRGAIASCSKKLTLDAAGLCLRALSHVGDNCIREIADLFTAVIRAGEGPDEWRNALIVSLLKPGKPGTDNNDWRPVGLTDCLCRIFEYVWLYRAKPFLEQSRASTQYGYETASGCEMAVGAMAEDVADGFRTPFNAQLPDEPSKRKTVHRTVQAFIDMTGAFPSLWPAKLCQLLLQASVPIYLIVWVWWWFKDRRCRLRHAGIMDDTTYPTPWGIVQGSILGGPLWIIYFDPALKRLEAEMSRIRLDWQRRFSTVYTSHKGAKGKGSNAFDHFRIGVASICDDLNLWATTPRLDISRDAVARLARVIGLWMEEVYIAASPKSGGIGIFGKREGAQQVADSLRDLLPIVITSAVTITIKAVAERVLGVWFDRSLTFEEHVQKLSREIETALGRLEVLQFMLHPAALRAIWCAVGLGRILFCAPIWWPLASEAAKERCEDWQVRAARIITSCGGTVSRTAVVYEAGLRPIEDMVRLQTTKLYARLSRLRKSHGRDSLLREPVAPDAEGAMAWHSFRHRARDALAEVPAAVFINQRQKQPYLAPLCGHRHTAAWSRVSIIGPDPTTSRSDTRMARFLSNSRKFLDYVSTYGVNDIIIMATDGAADRPITGGTAGYVTFFRVDQAADGSYVAIEIPGLGQAVPTGVGSVSYTAEIATGKAGLDILAQKPHLFDGKHVLWLTDSGSTTSAISLGTYRAKKFYPGTVVRQLCELVDPTRPAAARSATVMHVFSHVADSSDDDNNDGASATPPSTPPPNDGVLNINRHVDRAAGDAVKDVGHQLTPLTAVDENRIVSHVLREKYDKSNLEKWMMRASARFFAPAQLPPLPAEALRRLFKLRSGVCAAVGGVLFNHPHSCALCGERNLDRRSGDTGRAVRHIFQCPRHPLGTTSLTVQDLWKNPLEALAYCDSYIAALQPAQ